MDGQASHSIPNLSYCLVRLTVLLYTRDATTPTVLPIRRHIPLTTSIRLKPCPRWRRGSRSIKETLTGKKKGMHRRRPSSGLGRQDHCWSSEDEEDDDVISSRISTHHPIKSDGPNKHRTSRTIAIISNTLHASEP